MVRRRRLQDEVETAGVLASFAARSLVMTTLVRAEREGVLFLARRRRQHGDVGPETQRQFHAHVAEAAEARPRRPSARADLPVAQRRTGGDARAQQRRGPAEIEACGTFSTNGRSRRCGRNIRRGERRRPWSGLL